jgi:GNAT superfamily N-acetyltransferase
MAPRLSIRDPAPADETAWRNLWSQYNAFYQADIPEAVTASTWRRVLDPTTAVSGRLAVVDGAVAGFCICVLHDSTWTIPPVCYLEDLFVAPDFRGLGAGRGLIADALSRAKAAGCARVYWHTRAGNPARKLYDEFAEADDFVRYRLDLS